VSSASGPLPLAAAIANPRAAIPKSSCMNGLYSRVVPKGGEMHHLDPIDKN
jgi:hypothetical protein